MNEIRYKYKCEYCRKGFVREDRYLAHKCKKMERHAASKTALGTAAWSYYQTWMKLQNRAAPNSSAFINSKYFNMFIRFAEFVKAKNMPKVNEYIKMMVEEQNLPSIWTLQEYYNAYLTYLDKKADPLEMLINSVKTLSDYAEEHDLKHPSEAFDIIEVNELIDLVRKRRLSPWYLLNSDKFNQYLNKKVRGEQLVVLETLMKPHYWHRVFEEKRDIVNQIKESLHRKNL